jgi:hypothetical protein
MATYTANIIFENMFAQLDEEGKCYCLLDEIQDHKKDGNALFKDDGFIETRSGRRLRRLQQGGSWRCFGRSDQHTGFV